MQTCKFNVVGLGLSLGIVWAFSMLFIGLMSYYADYGTTFILTINSLYLLKEVTLANVFIGSVIGFVDGFIGGVVIAYLYNLFGGCRCSVDKGKE